MTNATEAGATQRTQLGASLEAGQENISYFQDLTFYLYRKVVLPLDGFVYWVRGDQLSASAEFNALRLNAAPFNAFSASGLVKTPAPTLTAKCDVHYSTSLSQEETETYSTNTVLVTTQEPIEDLNAIGPTEMYVASIDGVLFGFQARGLRQNAANVNHYQGNALYADMTTQVLQTGQLVNTNRLIVSNSLPIWLGLNGYKSQPWEPFTNPTVFYPSMLTPLNLRPPFATVHIEPSETSAIAGAPTYDATFSHEQLARDRVRVTTYGLGNDEAQDLVDFMLMWTANNPSVMGIMNSPIVKDEKRGQVEFQILAQKKTIDFEVNYYQKRARDIAQQVIRQVLIDFIPRDLTPPTFFPAFVFDTKENSMNESLLVGAL